MIWLNLEFYAKTLAFAHLNLYEIEDITALLCKIHNLRSDVLIKIVGGYRG